MKMPRKKATDWLFIWAFILFGVTNYACANHRNDEMYKQDERLCNNTKTEFGRMHMAKCMVRYSPKKLLILMEMCKKKVFGRVKFDQVLIAYCDRKRESKSEEWQKCLDDDARDMFKTSVSGMMREEVDFTKFLNLVTKCLSMDLKDYE